MSHVPEAVRGLNFYDIDKNLNVFLRRHAPELLKSHGKVLSEVGAFAGDRLDRQAEQSDQSFQPALVDRPDSKHNPQERRNQLRLNPEYEDCQQELYRKGLIADCFKGKESASHILPFLGQYLVCQSDIATGCPFAMTHPVAYLLHKLAPADVKMSFLPELLRRDGQTVICGTWATEKHSGSDVGNSVTKSVADQDGESHRLFGHNWFTSAFGFKRFIGVKTARPEGAAKGSKGLGLYLIPSHVDIGWTIPNNLKITHLKRKLGTRALPTVEVEIEGAKAYEIAPAGQGIKAMMTALGCSRVHNAMGAAGVMHRAYREALAWASHRETFGKKLIERPMIQKRLLDMATQWQAGSALAFEAARSFDIATRDPKQEEWMRIATALAKYKTAEQAVWCAQKALEMVGGNGYTEDYPTARQFRDAMVLTVWEGPEQIQALELMRMIAGAGTAPAADNAFLKRIAEIAQALPAEMQEHKQRLEKAHAELSALMSQLTPEMAELSADEFLHKMSDLLAYALLCDEAGWELTHDKDAKKMLVADHYYRMQAKGAFAAPQLDKTPLQAQFNGVVSGEKVAPPPSPQPLKIPPSLKPPSGKN